MPGLGGLTCLVIDGNVSGSHFPRQHPAAFHQAWCRGEPITWMLLTLCSLCKGLSDSSISPTAFSLPTAPCANYHPRDFCQHGKGKKVSDATLLSVKGNKKCLQISEKKIIWPQNKGHFEVSGSAKWPLIQVAEDGSPRLHYCQRLPPPLWQLGHGSNTRNALLCTGIANICRVSAPCVRVELSFLKHTSFYSHTIYSLTSFCFPFLQHCSPHLFS